ncbi:MAG: tryptophan 2,3-dioxygenase family protein [Psychroflexus sp.]|nr:tryptophan 2,3-dioxygenase family protein [Psychroflexus sp.]MDR9448246.1 tryptophan 2,3-dioxygenase family protein [Psychroflexus sp.]
MAELEQLLNQLREKYKSLDENPKAYLEGLLHSKPVNYWDYIQVETLLSLQKPETDFKDEIVFIIYHQVTELVLKLMNHEAQQISLNNHPDVAFFKDKINRLCRYTDMLITSFDVMRDGMSYEDYNKFRMSLTPASGFQSVQFRYLELYATPIYNLLKTDQSLEQLKNQPLEDVFEYLYWKSAGRDKKTHNKTLTLRLFEEKYQAELFERARKLKGKTIQERYQQLDDDSADLKSVMQKFDYLYNVAWPLVHLRTAEHYLESEGKPKAATGGSAWKRYLHPNYQKRVFFPEVWDDIDILDYEPSQAYESN